MTKVAIIGYGNIGKAVEQAVLAAPDMTLSGIYHHNDSLIKEVRSPGRTIERMLTGNYYSLLHISKKSSTFAAEFFGLRIKDTGLKTK